MQLDPKPATVAERLPASAAARSDAEKHSIRLRSLRSLRHISQFHVISAPIIEKTALGHLIFSLSTQKENIKI